MTARPDPRMRIGPRMRAIRDYVTLNPGASVTEILVAQDTSIRWRTHPSNRKAVYRAEAAGLIVIDRQQFNRYRVYDAGMYRLVAGRGVPIEPEPDGYWRPGHP